MWGSTHTLQPHQLHAHSSPLRAAAAAPVVVAKRSLRRVGALSQAQHRAPCGAPCGRRRPLAGRGASSARLFACRVWWSAIPIGPPLAEKGTADCSSFRRWPPRDQDDAMTPYFVRVTSLTMLTTQAQSSSGEAGRHLARPCPRAAARAGRACSSKAVFDAIYTYWRRVNHQRVDWTTPFRALRAHPARR